MPGSIRAITGQDVVPFGDCVISTADAAIASETCEGIIKMHYFLLLLTYFSELFTPKSPHIELGLDGVEIFTNGSGSHHQLRKLDQRVTIFPLIGV